jgi:hypothetical protein
MYFWLTAAISLTVVSGVAAVGVFYFKLNRLTMRLIGFLMAVPVVWLRQRLAELCTRCSLLAHRAS